MFFKHLSLNLTFNLFKCVKEICGKELPVKRDVTFSSYYYPLLKLARFCTYIPSGQIGICKILFLIINLFTAISQDYSC